MKELLKKVSDITMVEYTEKDLEAALEDLLNQYEYKVELLEDVIKRLEESIIEDYRPIPKSEFYGISERDFI